MGRFILFVGAWLGAIAAGGSLVGAGLAQARGPA